MIHRCPCGGIERCNGLFGGALVASFASTVGRLAPEPRRRRSHRRRVGDPRTGVDLRRTERLELNPCRHGIAALALVSATCGRLGPARTPAATADGAADLDLGGGAAGDGGALEEAASPAGGSIDTAPFGDCGSALSFQIVAAAGTDPGSFCTYGCYAVEEIVFTADSVQVTAEDIAPPNCVSLCDACSATPPCHSCPGISPFPSTGVNYRWDGAYWVSGTCGAQACRGPRVCAPTGHYAGRFCAIRGSTVSGRCTPRQGVGSEDVSCATIEFDLPSTAAIAVELGP
jgi:hypothetical protein